MIRRRRIPRYRLHRPSGQAVVTLSGRDFYLGGFGSEVSRGEYDRRVAEWLATGRRLPPGADAMPALSVSEVMLRYWDFCDGYYRNGDRPSPEWYHIRTALRVVRRLYGPMAAGEFGPLALKACREAFLARDQNRRTINQNVGRVKRMFRWAVENELVPASVFHGLQAVAGLRFGRCEARESEGVRAVRDEDVAAVLPHLSGPVAAMVRVQLLTGMRPGEVVIMRAEDLDRSGPVLSYRPTAHKNTHRGLPRVVILGPQAQRVLEPFVARRSSGFLFSPREAEEARSVRRRERRVSPLTPSQRARARKAGGAARWRERYDVDSYRRAVRRACERAGVPAWSPHQLRHTAATKLRRAYGIEAARVVLGHRSAAVTEIYAEMDQGKAIEAMVEVG